MILDLKAKSTYFDANFIYEMYIIICSNKNTNIFYTIKIKRDRYLHNCIKGNFKSNLSLFIFKLIFFSILSLFIINLMLETEFLKPVTFFNLF